MFSGGKPLRKQAATWRCTTRSTFARFSSDKRLSNFRVSFASFIPASFPAKSVVLFFLAAQPREPSPYGLLTLHPSVSPSEREYTTNSRSYNQNLCQSAIIFCLARSTPLSAGDHIAGRPLDVWFS
jgi:hypothetical protein